MTDNDITRASIVAALECKKLTADLVGVATISREHLGDIIDLINRLQADAEMYKDLYEELKSEHLETIRRIKSVKSAARKEFAEKLEERISVYTFSNKSDEYVEGFADALDSVNGCLDNILEEMEKEV